MTTIVLNLAIILVSVYIIQATDSPCDANNWGSNECIQYLQRTIQQLQDRSTTQSILLATQSAQLANITAKLNSQLEDLRIDTVPVGFIYAQLPDQLAPSQIWSTVSWIDISAEYAGLFFRVLGGNSAQFTVTQTENSPRITHVQTVWQPTYKPNDAIPLGLYSEGVSSGVQAQSAGAHWALSFFAPAGEVRPRNTAMRIWRRI